MKAKIMNFIRVLLFIYLYFVWFTLYGSLIMSSKSQIIY